MQDVPRIRVTMNSHASAEPGPNWSLGFHAAIGFFDGDRETRFTNNDFCVVHSPLTPTHTAKIPTPTTRASQLNAQRISATSGRISIMSHRPVGVLATSNP